MFLRLPTDPLPPLGDRAANEYRQFVNQVAQVHANLNTIRTKLRYHIRQPRLLLDLNISELRAQIDEIEARAVNKDTSEPHKNVRTYDKLPTPEVIVADSASAVVELIDTIIHAWESATSTTPIIFLDCEGVDLGRLGSLTIMQLYVPSAAKVYLLDVQTLEETAFKTIGTKQATDLKDALESRDLVRMMWDCRADSDALYEHYGVRLAGVVDAQLVENATAKRCKNFKTSFALDTSVSRRLNFSNDELLAFHSIKADVRLAIEDGPDYVLQLLEDHKNQKSKFQDQSMREANGPRAEANVIPAMAVRPIHRLIIDYCVQDVVVLPLLLERCMESKCWSVKWKERVQKESNKRLRVARDPNYDPSNMDMAAHPQGWPDIMRGEQYSVWERKVDPTWPVDKF